MSLYQQFKKAAPALTLAGLVACSPNKGKKQATVAQDTNVVDEPTANLVEAKTTNNSGVVQVAVTNWDAANCGGKVKSYGSSCKQCSQF